MQSHADADGSSSGSATRGSAGGCGSSKTALHGRSSSGEPTLKSGLLPFKADDRRGYDRDSIGSDDSADAAAGHRVAKLSRHSGSRRLRLKHPATPAAKPGKKRDSELHQHHSGSAAPMSTVGQRRRAVQLDGPKAKRGKLMRGCSRRAGEPASESATESSDSDPSHADSNDSDSDTSDSNDSDSNASHSDASYSDDSDSDVSASDADESDSDSSASGADISPASRERGRATVSEARWAQMVAAAARAREGKRRIQEARMRALAAAGATSAAARARSASASSAGAQRCGACQHESDELPSSSSSAAPHRAPLARAAVAARPVPHDVAARPVPHDVAAALFAAGCQAPRFAQRGRPGTVVHGALDPSRSGFMLVDLALREAALSSLAAGVGQHDAEGETSAAAGATAAAGFAGGANEGAGSSSCSSAGASGGTGATLAAATEPSTGGSSSSGKTAAKGTDWLVYAPMPKGSKKKVTVPAVGDRRLLSMPYKIKPDGRIEVDLHGAGIYGGGEEAGRERQWWCMTCGMMIKRDDNARIHCTQCVPSMAAPPSITRRPGQRSIGAVGARDALRSSAVSETSDRAGAELPAEGL